MAMKEMKFKAEMQQVMDLIIHSLYSHREIFLRELVSNACDAEDKLRFEALSKPELLGDEAADFRIIVKADAKANTLTIDDNGIGMTRDTVVEDLGTVARSGTKAFLEHLKDSDVKENPELIGQFGVGFYSAFMVADKVTVQTNSAVNGEKTAWESDGKGAYSIGDGDRETRGTSVTLHMREDASEYLEDWTLRQAVRKYSDFVAHPIQLEVIDKEGETKEIEDNVLNSQKALWTRAKSDIADEEYASFYQQISHDHSEPQRHIHIVAEGTMEYRAILYIPSQRPFDFFTPDREYGPALYVQRVQIMEQCEKLLPSYLRFVKGVVDSSDLPLNVSREILQENAVLDKIRNGLVSKILGMLKKMKEKEPDTYRAFFANFGDVLKEGLGQDFANREKLSDLLIFPSTANEADDAFTSLEDYVKAMPEDQEKIYFLTGDRLETLRKAPHLEHFKDKGQEVLLMASPIDEWLIEHIGTYKEKTFAAIDRGELGNTDVAEETTKAYEGLLKQFVDSKLNGIKEVRLSKRLKSSASCMVSAEDGMTAQMERIMRQMGQEVPAQERILELNPDHDAVKAMLSIYENDATDERIADLGSIFRDQALLAEGSRVDDPTAYAERVNRLLLGGLK